MKFVVLGMPTQILGFIVTSYPLRDIDAEFDGVPHILQIFMDDIPPEVARRDIHVYVSMGLEA
jgi:hypothetical protein